MRIKKMIWSITAAIILCSVLGGCLSHSFPVLRPAVYPDRSDIARQRAEEYFIQARDYERRNLPKMAEHFLELAYKLDPESETLRELLVEKYIVNGKYTQALIQVKGDKPVDKLTVGERRLIANLYMKMGQFGRAAEVMETISDLDASERYSLGFIYESIGNYKKAIENYSVYFKEDSSSLEMCKKLANLYMKENRFGSAESLYLQMEKFHGQSPEVLNGLGIIKKLSGDTALAVDFFKMALLIDTMNQESMRNIAQIFISEEKFDSAIPYYEKMYQSDSLGLLYGRTLGLLYYYNNQYEKAEEMFHILLSENINDYELHYYLSLIYSATERYGLAEVELEKSLSIRDNFSDSWQHLCYILLKNKDYERAKKTAERYTKAMANTSSAFRMLGYVYNVRKEYDNAIKPLEKAVSIDSLNLPAWFDLGSARERMGDYKKASEAFRRVLDLNPEDDAAANYLGYMWAEQNMKLDSAKALIETALRSEPENGAYLDSYAWVLFKMGMFMEAYSYMKMAVEKLDNDPVIYSHMGDILEKIGKDGEAMEAYRKSIDLGSEEKELLENKIRFLEKDKKATYK